MFTRSWCSFMAIENDEDGEDPETGIDVYLEKEELPQNNQADFVQ